MVQTLTLKTCKRTEEYHDEGSINICEARHLFRVAAGLESPLLGETAILGQIRRAYDEARAQERLTPNINKLFQTAIHVGHRVRTETTISRGAVSYSQVTVDILSRMVPDLGNKVVSIIGVNEMTESILNFLTARGATNLILSNRSFSKAAQLASHYGAEALPLAEKQRLLQLSDRADFTPSDRKMLLFDLANPKDIDDDVRYLIGKRLFNLEQIERKAKQNIEARKGAVAHCERIIEEEIAELQRWEAFRLVHSSCAPVGAQASKLGA